jgi:hypothetical protein
MGLYTKNLQQNIWKKMYALDKAMLWMEIIGSRS